MTNPRFLEQLEDRIAALERHARLHHHIERGCDTTSEPIMPDEQPPADKPLGETHKLCPYCGNHIKWGALGPKEYHDCKPIFVKDKPQVIDATGGTVKIIDTKVKDPMEIDPTQWAQACNKMGLQPVGYGDKPPVAQPGPSWDGSRKSRTVCTVSSLGEITIEPTATNLELHTVLGVTLKGEYELRKVRNDLRNQLAEAIKQRDDLKAKLAEANGVLKIERGAHEDACKQLAEAERERSNEHANMTDDLAEVINERDQLKAVLAKAVAERDAAFASRTLHRSDAAGLSDEISTLKEALRIAEEQVKRARKMQLTWMRDALECKEVLRSAEAKVDALSVNSSHMRAKIDILGIENEKLKEFHACFTDGDFRNGFTFAPPGDHWSDMPAKQAHDKWLVARGSDAG